MLIQMVAIHVKQGHVDEFLDAFRINYEGTRREPGNLRFDVLRSPEDDHSFVIYEVFKSAEALDEHRKTAPITWNASAALIPSSRGRVRKPSTMWRWPIF